jgi:negative regulator of flagellin synthesis FlgM
MSINSINAQNISRTYVQNADATQGASGATRTHHGGHHKAEQTQQQPQTDSVSLSESAKSLSAARQAVQESPDVRNEKVNDIKQRVQDGTYNVPSSVLARKMLNQQSQQ